ncbi:MAG: TolB family protein [Phycisphaerales bacterium JB063]
MDRHGFAFVRLAGLATLALVLGGCTMVRPLLLPVAGADGDPGDGGAWDDLDVYLVDPAGDDPAVRLTDTPMLMETDPDLNRDRDEVVYVERPVTRGAALTQSGAGLASRLVVVDTGGSGRRVLYEAAGLCLAPVWSHDGKRVAFSELNDEGRMQLKLINADGSGLLTLGYGSSPSWRKDDEAVFYSSQDSLDAPHGELRMRELGNGVIHDMGLTGIGYTNLRAGVSFAYYSPAYSQRNEAVWLLDGEAKIFRLTDPGPAEHDRFPVFFDSNGELCFTRFDDTAGTHRLMQVHRKTNDRVARPIAQPTRHSFTRGSGLWIAQHYPR